MRTESGRKSIENVKLGESVWAFDTANIRWSLRPVTAVHRHDYVGDVVTIRIGTENLRATGHHPFFVVSGPGLTARPAPSHTAAIDAEQRTTGRWVCARDLRVSDELVSLATGQTAKVEAISTCQERVSVYNLTIEGLSTFAVGEGGVLVHNPRGNPRKGSYGRSGQRVFPTSETALIGQRTRGSGRGGVTRYRKMYPDDPDRQREWLRQQQEEWIRRRFAELVNTKNQTPSTARSIIEGQILQQKRKPTNSFYRRILNELQNRHI